MSQIIEMSYGNGKALETEFIRTFLKQSETEENQDNEKDTDTV